MIVKCMARKILEKNINNFDVPTIIISIRSTGDTPPKKLFLHSNPQIKSFITLAFDDVTTYHANYYPITEQQAVKIAKFVMRHKDSVEQIIVHCDAGISRSAGVAAAIAKYLNGSDDDFFVRSPYTPNMTCYHKVLFALYIVETEEENNNGEF